MLPFHRKMYEDFKKYALEDAQAGYRLAVTHVVDIVCFSIVLDCFL